MGTSMSAIRSTLLFHIYRRLRRQQGHNVQINSVGGLQEFLRTAFSENRSPEHENSRMALIIDLYEATGTPNEVTDPAHNTSILDSSTMPNTEPTMTENRMNEAPTANFQRIMLVITEDIARRLMNGDAEQELGLILNQILMAHEFRGTPPTSSKVLENLPIIEMHQDLKDKLGQCTICCEEFIVGNSVLKLPCEHVFDKDCIMPWLKDHCSCPVCRYELPVEDEDYEKGRKERMANRDILEENLFNPISIPSALNPNPSSSIPPNSSTANTTSSSNSMETEQEHQSEIEKESFDEDDQSNETDEDEENSKNEKTQRKSLKEKTNMNGLSKRREESSYMNRLRRWTSLDRKRKS